MTKFDASKTQSNTLTKPYGNAINVLLVNPPYALFGDHIWSLAKSFTVLAYDQIATICLKGGCNQSKYCTSWTNTHRIVHCHKNSMYTTLMQKKSENFGESVDYAKCQRSEQSFLFFLGILLIAIGQKSEAINLQSFSAGLTNSLWSALIVLWLQGKRGTPELNDRLPHDNGPNSQCTALQWGFVL